MREPKENAIRWSLLKGLEWYLDTLCSDLSDLTQESGKESLRESDVLNDCYSISYIFEEYRKKGGTKSLMELIEADFME